MQMIPQNKLNLAQLNLIKSFQFLRSEKQIGEIDSLINFYLEKKLDEAIAKTEARKDYNAEIYEQWLSSKNR